MPLGCRFGKAGSIPATSANTPIWITEASNNKNGVTAAEKAHEYLAFWKELQQRPSVQGVTYFIASASDPAFASEVFVGRGIARIIGAR